MLFGSDAADEMSSSTSAKNLIFMSPEFSERRLTSLSIKNNLLSHLFEIKKEQVFKDSQ